MAYAPLGFERSDDDDDDCKWCVVLLISNVSVVSNCKLVIWALLVIV